MHATWDEAIAFHGHMCSGLAHGYRASLAAMTALSAQRADDEELVALVENDACGVDAIQVVTGCTVGKGNLILLDYGKPGYTFYSRRGGKAVRVVVDGSPEPEPLMAQLRDQVRAGTASESQAVEYEELRSQMIRRYVELPLDQGIAVHEVEMAPPLLARTFPSVTCERCGERVMEPRARVRGGQIVCLPCHDQCVARWSKAPDA